MTDEEMSEQFNKDNCIWWEYDSLSVDEEMADKYIKDNCERWECDCLSVDDIAKENFLAGLKAGRQWHDLRKDKNDLPKDITSLYLVRVYSWDFGLSHLYKKYGMYIPTVCEWSGEYFKALNDMAYSNARNIKSCIAWCEIPTFDKE